MSQISAPTSYCYLPLSSGDTNSSVDQIVQSVSKDELLTPLQFRSYVDQVKKERDKFSPHQLGVLLERFGIFAKNGFSDPKLYDTLAQVFTKNWEKMGGEDLARAAFGFSQLIETSSYYNEELVALFCRALVPKLAECNCEALHSIVWAFTSFAEKGGFFHKEFLDECAQTLQGKISSCSDRDLYDLILGFGTFAQTNEYLHPLLISAFAEEMQNIIGQYSKEELVELAFAFGAFSGLGCNLDQNLYRLFSKTFCENLPTYGPALLAKIAVSFATFSLQSNYEDRDLFQALCSRLKTALSACEEELAHDSVLAFALFPKAVCCSDHEVLQKLAAACKEKIDRYSPDDLAGLIMGWAEIAEKGFVDQELNIQLHRAAQAQKTNFTSKDAQVVKKNLSFLPLCFPLLGKGGS